MKYLCERTDGHSCPYASVDHPPPAPPRIAEGHEGHGDPCYYCKEPCDALAGNPGRWPVGLCHPDDPGVLKWYHHDCVFQRLHPEKTMSLRKFIDNNRATGSTTALMKAALAADGFFIVPDRDLAREAKLQHPELRVLTLAEVQQGKFPEDKRPMFFDPATAYAIAP